MSKSKVLLVWGILFAATTAAFFGCERGFYFEDSRIPSSELPRVLLIDPADGLKNVPVNAKICILFSDQMDAQSVARSLIISIGGGNIPLRGDAWSVYDGGRLFIYDEAGLLFPPNTEVGMAVGTSAVDLDGYHMDKVVESRFTTSPTPYADESPPSVDESKMAPANEEIVTLDSSVSFEFTEGMLRGTVERSFLLQSNDGSVPDSRDYRNGRFFWDGRRVLYIPDEPLKLNDARYEVSLNNNGIPCRDIAGNTYPDASPVLNFYTISESVIYASPSPSGSDSYDGRNKEWPKATISGAVQAARGYGFNVIKAAVGDYWEAVTLIDGIALYGGYQPGFGSEVRTDGSRVFAPPSADQAFTISGVSGCTIDRFEIHGPPSGQPKPCAVAVEGGSKNITIQNCTIVGTDGVGPSESVGVRIENSSDIRVRANSISGGRGATSSTGVSVTGNGPGITLAENMIEGGMDGFRSNRTTGVALVGTDARVGGNLAVSGGSGSRNVGVSVSGGSNRSVIGHNELIRGGNAGEVIGIEVQDGAAPDIRDNEKITGGTTSTANAFGILVGGQANPHIARNLVIGGAVTGGAGKAFGVHYDNTALPPFSCNLFNNFILGGEQSCDRDASCYGVYLRNTNALIVNNTIDGGGHYDGSQVASANTYGVFATVDPSDAWTISPKIINNYIIGGNSNSSFGVRLYSNGQTPLSGEMFNNVFNFSNLVTNASYLGIGTTGVSSIGDITQLNESVGASYMAPAPQNNLSDPFTLASTFADWAGADYHVNTPSVGIVANKGYTGVPSGIPPGTLYGLRDLLIDIDSLARYTLDSHGSNDYSLVDLGADEVQ